MGKISNNTWMEVDYPVRQRTIGYVSVIGERQVISMLGGQYRVQDLLKSGYTFSPLIPATQEFIRDLETAINYAISWVDERANEKYIPEIQRLEELLRNLKEGNE